MLIHIAALLNNRKARLFLNGRKHLFRKIETAMAADVRPRIWVHCASLGEFEQGRPVIEAIRQHYPQFSIVLTFFSPSGFEVKKNYEYADHIFYLPVDSRRNARRFVQLVKPEIALFVKYEFWYHYLHVLHQTNIPAVLFSAVFQPRHPFFKWYGGLHRNMLSWYRQVFVQDAASAQMLREIGIAQVQVAGDTRFDRVMRISDANRSFPAIETFKGAHPLLIAGSTWPEDETLLRETMALLPPGYKLLLAPHETDAANIRRIQQLFGGDACPWDASADELTRCRVGIVHTVGYLSHLYKYADAVWIGGGFTKSGIHNIIEPAVFGVPVFFGPNYSRYREATEMIAAGGAVSLSTAAALQALLLQNKNALLQTGSNAKKYVMDQLGATDKILRYLAEKCLAIRA